MVDLVTLAAVPMRDESEMQMVEIIVLKWKCPDVEAKCAERIIRNTRWPFKLTFYDNRPNTPNTSRIWNKLIRAATCEYVCLLDSDVFVPDLEPCWLTRMMQTFTIRPDCRLVVPLTNRCASPQQRADGPEPYPTVQADAGVWAGFCFLMRKSLLDEIGQFDEEFVGYGQDSEFAVRLSRNGGGAYIRRDVWVEHLHGASFKAATTSGEHDAAADRAYAQQVYLRKIGQ
jgi:hypothetical protein